METNQENQLPAQPSADKSNSAGNISDSPQSSLGTHDAEQAQKIAANPRAAHFKGANPEDNPLVGAKEPTGAMALNPSMSHEDIVPADSLPSEKKVTSDITGAESEGDIGTAAAGAGFTGGHHGRGTASEGRAGNPENYGGNQFGPGLATGPMNTDPFGNND